MHIPVLLKEVIDVLAPKPGKFVIDGTYGAGGHAQELIKGITPGGTFLGIDWDKQAIQRAKQELSPITNNQLPVTNIILTYGNYVELPEILKEHNLGKADGILIDLGFSSDQLTGKGFSFMEDVPLDMRYNTMQTNADYTQNDPEQQQAVYGAGAEKSQRTSALSQRESASWRAVDLVNNLNAHDLEKIFREYGEERKSRRIAEAIVKTRKEKPIVTAQELAKVIESVIPRSGAKIHPATKVFQALRIAVNRELENLQTFLNSIPNIVKPNGRIAIISFHSLEDRIVKRHFITLTKNNMAKIITKKPVRATQAEIKTNPRARSAKLRAMQFIAKINNS